MRVIYSEDSRFWAAFDSVANVIRACFEDNEIDYLLQRGIISAAIRDKVYSITGFNAGKALLTLRSRFKDEDSFDRVAFAAVGPIEMGLPRSLLGVAGDDSIIGDIVDFFKESVAGLIDKLPTGKFDLKYRHIKTGQIVDKLPDNKYEAMEYIVLNSFGNGGNFEMFLNYIDPNLSNGLNYTGERNV